MKRYLLPFLEKDLRQHKMVFIGGPRQVGKTTLSHLFSQNPAHYLNWDDAETRRRILANELPYKPEYLIFDEIHKYKEWRNFLKGFYDLHNKETKIIVTGSARLDYYRRGGDSLMGRYFYYRLSPLSLNELPTKNPNKKDLLQLLQFGGFPEPFFSGEESFWRRWSKERRKKVIQEDLIDLERVKEVSTFSLLADILPDRASSLLSIKSLKEDLLVAHETVDRWLEILENLYYIFRLSPYQQQENKIKLMKKERKVYMWDWSAVIDIGAKFENLVASQLLKYCHFIEDTEGFEMNLYFLRDQEKREIDFIVTKDKKPLFAVECKSGEKSLSRHIPYFAKRTDIPFFYQVHLGEKNVFMEEYRARLMPFIDFCRELKMP